MCDTLNGFVVGSNGQGDVDAIDDVFEEDVFEVFDFSEARDIVFFEYWSSLGFVFEKSVDIVSVVLIGEKGFDQVFCAFICADDEDSSCVPSASS